MKHSERFALDHFLTEYPRNLSFDEVIDMILDDDNEDVGLVEMINDLRQHFECVVDGMKWGIELARLTEEDSEAERATHTQTN